MKFGRRSPQEHQQRTPLEDLAVVRMVKVNVGVLKHFLKVKVKERRRLQSHFWIDMCKVFRASAWLWYGLTKKFLQIPPQKKPNGAFPSISSSNI